MEVKLLLLMNFVIVANCQSTISNRNDATREYELIVDMKSEMESIRQLLMNLQQDAVRSVTHAIQEMKSEIEEIRQVVIQLKNGIAAQPMHAMRSDIGEIHQIVLKQQNCNDTQAIQELNLKTEEIRQLVLRQHGNETQAMQEMKSKTEEIRQIMLKQHGNETQAIKEIKSKTDEIRQAVIQQLSRPRKDCPFGFDYLPEAGSCFTFIAERLTWDSATDRCRGIMPGVHLAAITSQAENVAITRYLQSQFSKNNIGPAELRVNNGWAYAVWISGQRRNAGQCNDVFVWKTLKGIKIPFNYTNWNAGEPNCAQRESCVHIAPGNNHGWNDYVCDTLNFPLCEI